MQVIAQRVWREPAVFVGLLTAIVLAIINVIGTDDWGMDNLIAVFAPLASSLGIRQLVSPAIAPAANKTPT